MLDFFLFELTFRDFFENRRFFIVRINFIDLVLVIIEIIIGGDIVVVIIVVDVIKIWGCWFLFISNVGL